MARGHNDLIQPTTTITDVERQPNPAHEIVQREVGFGG